MFLQQYDCQVYFLSLMPRVKQFLSESSGVANLSLSFQCYKFFKELSMNECKAVDAFKINFPKFSFMLTRLF